MGSGAYIPYIVDLTQFIKQNSRSADMLRYFQENTHEKGLQCCELKFSESDRSKIYLDIPAIEGIAALLDESVGRLSKQRDVLILDLADRIRGSVPTPAHEEDVGDPDAPEAASPVPEAAKKGVNRSGSGYFHIAATTPDGRLYQLERRHGHKDMRGGAGYEVYEVNPDGQFRPCPVEGFPERGRDKAAARFREWAESNGYEVLVGSETRDSRPKKEEAGERAAAAI